MSRTLQILLVFFFAGMSLNGQQICKGASVTLTVPNPNGLTSPVYSCAPCGYTTLANTFTVAPQVTTQYTLYVTGQNTNSVWTTESNVQVVTVVDLKATIASPDSFVIGCGKNYAAVAMSVQPASSASSYTLQSSQTSSVMLGTMPPATTVNLFFAGTWTLSLFNPSVGCNYSTTFAINQVNDSVPVIDSIFLSNPITCSQPVATVMVNSKPNETYKWLPTGIVASSTTVSALSAWPNYSIAQVFTLEATGPGGACTTRSVFTVLQNLFRPKVQIGASTTSCSNPSVMLSNQSISTIPPAFTPTAPVMVSSWKGPPPQPIVAASPSYAAKTSGFYTLEVTDLNNGCVASATAAANITPGAVFAHAIASGTASFTSQSAGTSAATAYYWDFGDGTFTTSRDPVHTYQAGGAHLVRMKVINSATKQCADSVMQVVNITGVGCAANAGFTLEKTSVFQEWNATPHYPWNVSAVDWDWGDGSHSDELYTSHVYAVAAAYEICLSVTVTCGGTSVSCPSYRTFRAAGANEIIRINVRVPELKPTSVHQLNDAAQVLNVYPNPGSGMFRIVPTHDFIGGTQVHVLDLTGRTVHAAWCQPVSGDDAILLNLQGLAPGVYQVCVGDGNSRQAARLIVVH